MPLGTGSRRSELRPRREPCRGSRLGSFSFGDAIAGVGRCHERRYQPSRRIGDLFNRPVECCLIRFRRRVESAQLAHELKSRRVDLFFGRWRIEVEQSFDASAHVYYSEYGRRNGAAASSARPTAVNGKAMLAGPTLPTFLRRCQTNDYRPASSARKRHAIASEGLVDQARDRRTSECGRALHENPARVGGPLQQFFRVRQSFALIEVQLHAVRACANGKNALVPMLVRRKADDEAVAIFVHDLMGGGQTLLQRPSHCRRRAVDARMRTCQ